MSAKPPTSSELRDSIMTVLGSLPHGCEIRFWWQDDKQHLSMQFDGQPAQVLYINRLADGTGVPTPKTQH